MKVHTYENSSGKDLIKKDVCYMLVENKENSPTLKTLCSILDVLGYEIKFEPKQRV